MNSFYKFAPNCRGAKTLETYEHGDVIMMTNKYGQESEYIIRKLVIKKSDGYNYYSITKDGKTYAEKKAEKYGTAKEKILDRSDIYYKASNEGRDFLSLAEPIKIGHHSEGRHRALIERNRKRMGKCVAEKEKAQEQEKKEEYREKKSKEINLGMPESVEYYKQMAEKTAERQRKIKSGEIEKGHSYTLVYANKNKKDAEKNYELAKKIRQLQTL